MSKAELSHFVEGTNILTIDGYKKIENIMLLDLVLSYTHTFQKVLNLQRKLYSGKLYYINNFIQPKTIICTDSQSFYIREKINNKLSEPIKKKACDLTINDYFGMVINTNKYIPKFTIDDEIIILNNSKKWKYLGYYMSTGIIIPKYNYLSEILNEYYYNNHELKYFPEWIIDAPINFIHDFIDGLTLDIYSNPMCYQLAYGLQRLFLKIGRIMIIKNDHDNEYMLYLVTSNVYNVSIKYNNHNAFIENNYVWYQLTSIYTEDTMNTLVYNIKTLNDNTYIVENTICIS
jgi:hypothetical protein